MRDVARDGDGHADETRRMTDMDDTRARRVGTDGAAGAPRAAILVASFGTSFNDSRHVTIGAIEDTIRERFFPAFEVRRAFTSRLIINKLARRDGVVIDGVTEAMRRAAADGIRRLVVQPTHLMAGNEHARLVRDVRASAGLFDAVSLGRPLLDDDADYAAVIDAIVGAMARFDDGRTALCLMGHGTDAAANAGYLRLQDAFVARGLTQYVVGTVEATPTFDDMVAAVVAGGYERAVVRPLMVVAGDHANVDMADETNPDSLAHKLRAAGVDVTCVIEGLGQLVAIDELYAAHAAEAIARLA